MEENKSGDRERIGSSGVQLPAINTRSSADRHFNNRMSSDDRTQPRIEQHSSSTKYSKYSSRGNRGANNQHPIAYWMRKVIKSVDKRKKLSTTLPPTSLGIKSIILGSNMQNQDEEGNDYGTNLPYLSQNYSTNVNASNQQRIGVTPTNMQNKTDLSPLVASANLKDPELKDKIKRQQYSSRSGNSFKLGEDSKSDRIMESSSKNLGICFDPIINKQDEKSGPKDQQSESKASDISMRYDNKTTQNLCDLMNLANTSGRIFIPIRKVEESEPDYDTKIYVEENNPPMNHEGTVVFSKQGFITVGKGRGQPSEYVSHDNFILNGINVQIFQNLPLFSKFEMLKTFKQWKYAARYNRYCRTRTNLCKNLVLSKPQFSDAFGLIVVALNEIKDLKFLEIKRNAVFARKQQSLIEKCEKVDIIKALADLQRILLRITNYLTQLKTTIQKSDTQLEDDRRKWQELSILKKSKYDEHIVFTQAKKQQKAESEKLKISQLRHKMYSKLIGFVTTYLSQNLSQVLFTNKRDFTETFLDTSISPQFELSVCFNLDGKVDVTPTFEDHYASFLRLLNSVERAIQNPSVFEFYENLSELHFPDVNWSRDNKRIIPGQVIANIYACYETTYHSIEKKPPAITPSEQSKSKSESNVKLKKEVAPTVDSLKDFASKIFFVVENDISQSREFVSNFNETQEIYDFAEEWKRKIKNVSPETTFYKETWVRMNRFNGVISRIPNHSTKRGTILIETLGFKNFLNELPKMVIDSIRYNVASTMEKDTRALKDDLYKVVETLEQAPSSINIYLEQINMCKYITFKMPEFTQKFQSIDNLNELCKGGNSRLSDSGYNMELKISTALQEDIQTVKELYEKLPAKLAEAEEALKAKQVSIETIIHTSSDTLSKKIRAFQKKYIETYLQDKARIDECHQTLEELFKRSKAIQEIKSKVILYKEFFDRKVELESSKNFDKLHELHIQTINLWKMILYWRKRREMCNTTPFLQLDIDKVIRSVKKTTRYFEEKTSKYPLLKEKSKVLAQVILNQTKETSTLINFLKNCKKKSLKQRHWTQIFTIIKAPHLKTSQKFTIINLREVHIQNYMDEVNKVIEQADLEMKYENIISRIERDWDHMKLKVIPYIPGSVNFILSETDTIFDMIEDHLSTLESVHRSKNASHVKEKIEEWIKNLIIMRENLDKWMEAQNNWIYLDPIFASSEIQDALPQDYKQFLELQDLNKRIYFSAYLNPKAFYNLVVNNRAEVFNHLINYFSKVKKAVDNYLESRRLRYPRFFFLSDSDFLEFLTKTGAKQDTSRFINQLFPGASSLLISTSEQECCCEDECDGNCNKLGNIKIKESEGGAELPEIISGMISSSSELLLFERSVVYTNAPEVWLLKVEYCSQETISKLIGYAVSSFPKQPLDEWIIDYPQQTILSTIHLILTHEINEMLHEMKPPVNSEGRSVVQYASSDTMGILAQSSTVEANLIPKQTDISKKESEQTQKSKQEEAQNTTSQGPDQNATVTEEKQPDETTEEQKNKSAVEGDVSGDKTQNPDQTPQAEVKKEVVKVEKAPPAGGRLALLKQQEEAKLKELEKKLENEKIQYLKNMFGVDYDINIIKESGFDYQKLKLQAFIDETMKALQEKSFRGLYLRLQFWINQVYKSLLAQLNNCNFKLSRNHIKVMKTIVCFLTYMRDVVMELKVNGVADYESYDWQKQMRLTWNATEPGCKVECGGWSTYQGNEYLGSQVRLIITPLTNRYFVFLSAALREKSGAIFQCTPGHFHANSVFEDFASICTVPLRCIQITDLVSASIIQYLNGAALTNTWIHYKNLDQLCYSEFRSFVKELQMVQQQFIISELANESDQSSDQRSNSDDEKNFESSQAELSLHSEKEDQEMTPKKAQMKDQEIPYHRGLYSKTVSFAIFGSFRHQFPIEQQRLCRKYCSAAQSGFRILGLVKPDNAMAFEVILSCEGFRDEAKSLSKMIIYYFKVIEKIGGSESQQFSEAGVHLTQRDGWMIARLARTLTDNYLKDDIEYNSRQEPVKISSEIKRQASPSSYPVENKFELFENEIKEKQEKRKLIIEEFSVVEACDLFCKSKIRSSFVKCFENDNSDPDEKFEYIMGEARQQCREWKTGKIDDYSDLSFKVPEATDNKKEEAFNPKQQGVDKERMKNIKIISDKMKQDYGCQNLVLANKVYSIFEALKFTKGCVIAGPRCSGKTSIIKYLGVLMQLQQPKIEIRTSVLNPDIYPIDQLYGSADTGVNNPELIQNKETKMRISSITSSVLKIALEGFESLVNNNCPEEEDEKESERPLQNSSDEDSTPEVESEDVPKLLKTLLFESQSIDPLWSDCLIHYFKEANSLNKIFSKDCENNLDTHEINSMITMRFPNCATCLLPKDLMMMFETDSIQDVSPSFLNNVTVIPTEETSITWEQLFEKGKAQLKNFIKNETVSQIQHLDSFDETFNEFVIPFIKKLDSTARIKSNSFWQMKSLVIRCFKFLDGLISSMMCVERDLRIKDDPIYLPIKAKAAMIVSNLSLMAVVWTFGAILNHDLRRLFEDLFFQYRRKFDLKLTGNLGSSSVTGRNAKVTLFDIYFDIERLHWDLISERIGSRISDKQVSRSHLDPQSQHIIVSSQEIAQGMLMFDTLLENKTFHIMFEGKDATHKTTVLSSISKKQKQKCRSIWIPLTVTTSIDKCRKVYEKFFKTSENRFIMTPLDSMKPLFIIDDLHLEDHLTSNISEFLRMWENYGGYYNIENGHFINIENLRVLCSRNPRMLKNKKNIDRFTYYINTIYFDELDNDRFRMFVQEWLTNKSWSTSKLVNKYILITNSLMSIKEKISKNEKFSESLRLKKFSLHHFVRLLSNFSIFTLMLDEENKGNEKEEEIVAQLLAFELSCTFGDTMMSPSTRNEFLTKIQEVCKHNFLIQSVTPEKEKTIAYGNFHDLLKPNAKFIYSKQTTEDFKGIVTQLITKLKLDSEKSTNYLRAYLESPGFVRLVYKVARLFVVRNSHVCLIGPPRASARELVQLACLVYPSTILFEPEVRIMHDVVKFRSSFKSALILTVRQDRDVVFIYDSNHLDDQVYIDYMSIYMTLFDNDSIEIFDQQLCNELIEAQREITAEQDGNQNKKATSSIENYNKSKYLTDSELYTLAIGKLSAKFHIVICVNNHQEFLNMQKWRLLESYMSCIFLEDTVNEDVDSTLHRTQLEASKAAKAETNQFKISYEYFSKMQLFNTSPRNALETYQDMEPDIERRTRVLAKRMAEIKGKIHNSILDLYEGDSKDVSQASDDGDSDKDYKKATPLPDDMKLEGNSEMMQMKFKRSIQYNVPITPNFNSKYIIFHEMIRFLHDFISTSLMIRRNYYESLVTKTNDLVEFYSSTVVKKKDLHSKNFDITVEMLSIKDTIEKLEAEIQDKTGTISRRIKEIGLHTVELKNLERELANVSTQRDLKIKKIISVILQASDEEYTFITRSSKYSAENEQLIYTLGKIVTASVRGFRSREEIEIMFSSKEHLSRVLSDKKSTEFDEEVFAELKKFITKFSPNDFSSKPLLKNICKYLVEIYRKTNMKNSMESTYQRITNLKTLRHDLELAVNFTEKRKQEMDSELEILKAKYAQAKSKISNLETSISDVEISHVRSAQVINSTTEIAEQTRAKLSNTQERMKNILGDCIMLACSVVYLGVFCSKSRIAFRRSLRDTLETFSIKCSPEWQSEDPEVHCLLFKEICEEICSRKQSNFSSPYINEDNCSTQMSNTIGSETSLPVLYESVFSLLFSPSTPVCFDPAGILSDFVRNILTPNSKVMFAGHKLSLVNPNAKTNEPVKKSNAQDPDDNDQKDEQDGVENTFGEDIICLYDLNPSTQDNNLLKSTWDPVLHRLCCFSVDDCKGIDKKGAFRWVDNKKICCQNQVSLFQINVFCNNLRFNFSQEFEARCCVVSCPMISGEKQDWIAVKEILMKYFQPEVYSEMMRLKRLIVPKLKDELDSLQWSFESVFCLTEKRHLHDGKAYSQLQNNIRNINLTKERLEESSSELNGFINSNSILIKLSKYLTRLYEAMLELCALTDEPVYSWKMYRNIIDSVISKIVRDAASNKRKQKAKREGQESDDYDGNSAKADYEDEGLLKCVLPNVYSVVCAGYSQDNIPMLNLVFALEIGIENESLTRDEFDFFFKNFLKFPNFKDWRKPETNFIRISDTIDKSAFIRLKRSLLRLYPKRRKLFEDLGESTFTYKTIIDKVNTHFAADRGEKPKLMESINVSFLCPDHEFRSMICQIVYQELLAIFDFNEELIKLHSFIKTASWSHPIAVKTHESINIVNTICSIASYYDVSLEVVRSDSKNPVLSDPNFNTNMAIYSNVKKCEVSQNTKVTTDKQSIPAVLDCKPPKGFSMKYKVSDNDKEKDAQGIKSALSIIEKCAQNGSWVLISTPEFPRFWYKMCKMLDKLRDETNKGGSTKILNSFRIFVDLQALEDSNISHSFLSEYSVRFILTETNNEDMEGFNDVWANILNGDILNISETISENPSAMQKQLKDRKADLSIPNQLALDLSAITNNEVNKTVEKLIDNKSIAQAVIQDKDVSKDDQLLEDIKSALQKQEYHSTKQPLGESNKRISPLKEHHSQKIEELKQESSQDGDLDRKEDADENKEENEVKSAKNKDTENPKGSNQKTEDGAIIEDKSYSKSMSNQSKNSL